MNHFEYNYRPYDQAKDFKISFFPRLPVHFDKKSVIAISENNDFTHRILLTNEGSITVVEEVKSKEPIGSYCAVFKNVMLFGHPRRLCYAFDYVVDPQFRKNNISVLLNNHLELQMKKEKNTIFYASTLKSNKTMTTRMTQLGINPFSVQRQSAWKLENPVELPRLPIGINVRIWDETNQQQIKERWLNAFKNYSFTPSEFDDILITCNKYLVSTYFLQFRKGDNIISESSISLWNQDLLYTLKETLNNNIQSHRQLFSCYSIGLEKDLSFKYLLRYIHNEQLKQGINYLFTGISTSDPLISYFPLVYGIKSVEFTSYLALKSKKDIKNLKKLVERKLPIFSDPRDYGILYLYPEELKQFKSNL